MAKSVLVFYGLGTLCTIGLRPTSHTRKASRHAMDPGCCRGLEEQHRLQAFYIREVATRPLLLSSLHQVHIYVLDKIFQIAGLIYNKSRHQNEIQRLATLQYSSHFIHLYTVYATAFRPELVRDRWTHCPHVCCKIYVNSRGMTKRWLSPARSHAEVAVLRFRGGYEY